MEQIIRPGLIPVKRGLKKGVVWALEEAEQGGQADIGRKEYEEGAMRCRRWEHRTGRGEVMQGKGVLVEGMKGAA